MTNDRVKHLGIFMDWEVFSCQECSRYSKFADLSEHGGLILCKNCVKDASLKAKQIQLFDDQKPLFS